MESKRHLLTACQQILNLSQKYARYGRSRLKDLFVTRLCSCELCGGSCEQYSLLCQTCVSDLPYFKAADIQGNLLNWPAISQALPKVSFDHLVALSPYQWPLTSWVKQLKYQGRFELATLLGQLLANYWQQHISPYIETKPELVLAVPLHFSKWQLRGYNQAHLIAEAFAKNLGYPYCPTTLMRVKKTGAQVGQGGIARRQNLRRAFSVNSNTLPQHVLLIDDVITTGSTVNEICTLLKTRGVVKVTVVAACLTLPG